MRLRGLLLPAWGAAPPDHTEASHKHSWLTVYTEASQKQGARFTTAYGAAQGAQPE